MLPRSVQKLIDEFNKLPGIGPRSAARLAFYLLTKPEEDINNLGSAVINLKKNLIYCQVCYNIAESNPCKICADERRDKSIICVVEEPLDVIALGKTDYLGLYHVLGGVISPIDGIGPDNLRMAELLGRIKNDKIIKEVIVATDPSLEGEATSIYISEEIKKMKETGEAAKDIKVTRLARGLPVGGDLEYADEVTLKRSIEGRNNIE